MAGTPDVSSAVKSADDARQPHGTPQEASKTEETAPATKAEQTAANGIVASPTASPKSDGNASSPTASPKSGKQVADAGASISARKRKKEAAEIERKAKRAKLESESMVVFGLGNLGAEAAKQRHNVGHRVLQRVISRTGATPLEEKEGAAGVCQLPGTARRKLLLPPQSAINDSGPALKSALEALGHPNATVLAVVDDTALSLGVLRFKQKGSSGGHNGLKSIEGIWGEEYHRLKLGISHTGAEGLKDHVLGEFQDAEKPVVEAIVERAAEAVELWLTLGPEEVEKVMAKVNSPSFRQVSGVPVAAAPTVMSQTTATPS